MPDIYSHAWNVVVWLGDLEGRSGLKANNIPKVALDLIPKLLNLKVLDAVLRSNDVVENILRSWIYFGRILNRAWFTRRWVSDPCKIHLQHMLILYRRVRLSRK
jgi:hypothetical protein